uniref:Uncharacterized protein n=1 Tax=Trypanosoma congolense (strain IL3000) TaxID=1068625 RepID=G0UUZ8_TRYCI|nr:conserved hypothetical protein [Trypanosoma congolense IL3000]
MFSTLGSWSEGIHNFLMESAQSTVEPWYLSYEERRRLAKEPRIIHQLQLEDEWKQTCLEGVWAVMRRFARPINDFRVSEACFHEYLSYIGISNEYLRCRIADLFLSGNSDINCLVVCKVLYMGLTDENTSSGFLEHCYRCLPSNLTSSNVEYLSVKKACEAQRSIKDKKFATELRAQQLEGVLSYMDGAGCTELDLDTFKTLFFDPNRCIWAGTFIKCIYEAGAKYFGKPYGVLPAIPLRWLSAIEPLPFDRNAVYDADSILLRNTEVSGKEISAIKKSRKKIPKHAKEGK